LFTQVTEKGIFFKELVTKYQTPGFGRRLQEMQCLFN